MITQFQSRPAFGNPLHGVFALFAYSDADPRIRARRRMELCVALSLLIHGLLFLISMQHRIENSGAPSRAVQGPLTVRLTRLPPPSPAVAVQPAVKPRPAPRARAIVALSRPTPHNAPAPVEPPAAAPDQAPPQDMLAMLNAARARRGAANDNDAEALENSREPSSSDIAMANIARSLQQASNRRHGTSGVFEILSKGVRTGQFSFRGWTPGLNNNWRETIDVDAGLGGNVELAMVRKMIELIRRHYSGDFNWESHRLGRVVTLSARMSDNAELEAFLMREFFDG